MTRRSDLIAVKQFMTESQTNIDIATAVYNEYENARETIIKEFFGRVSRRLKGQRKFQSWETVYDGRFFIEQYSAYRFRKKTWQSKYDVRIEAWQRGDRMLYGVWRDKDQLKHVERNNPLFQALRQKLPGAKLRARDYFEAEIWMDFPEPDWRQPRVIWRMAKDKKFELEVATLLVELAETAEEYVDRLMRNRGI